MIFESLTTEHDIFDVEGHAEAGIPKKALAAVINKAIVVAWNENEDRPDTVSEDDLLDDSVLEEYHRIFLVRAQALLLKIENLSTPENDLKLLRQQRNPILGLHELLSPDKWKNSVACERSMIELSYYMQSLDLEENFIDDI